MSLHMLNVIVFHLFMRDPSHQVDHGQFAWNCLHCCRHAAYTPTSAANMDRVAPWQQLIVATDTLRALREAGSRRAAIENQKLK